MQVHTAAPQVPIDAEALPLPTWDFSKELETRYNALAALVAPFAYDSRHRGQHSNEKHVKRGGVSTAMKNM